MPETEQAGFALATRDPGGEVFFQGVQPDDTRAAFEGSLPLLRGGRLWLFNPGRAGSAGSIRMQLLALHD